MNSYWWSALQAADDARFLASAGRTLAEAEAVRNVADYGGGVMASEEAGAILSSMEQFMQTAERVLAAEEDGGTNP